MFWRMACHLTIKNNLKIGPGSTAQPAHAKPYNSLHDHEPRGQYVSGRTGKL
jgi:hypothetical protein